jgi:hypothetical protein
MVSQQLDTTFFSCVVKGNFEYEVDDLLIFIGSPSVGAKLIYIDLALTLEADSHSSAI